MDIDPATDTPVAREFQRAMVFSFTTRQEHNGNITSAFLEFTGEPDINGHWATLGKTAVADMITYAVRLVHETRKKGGGGNLDFLPMEIRTHEGYAPLVDAARTLLRSMDLDGPTVAAVECVRLVEDITTPDAVALFAILVMTLFPPRGDAS